MARLNMIRSTATTLKFANTTKKKLVHSVIDEYRKVVQYFIDVLWEQDKIPVLLPKDITSAVDTNLSARMVQCAGKQASGIVRGTRKKQQQREYIVAKLTKEGKHKQARKLQWLIDKTMVSKPNIQNVCPELDARFIKIDLNSPTSFDGWITLSSIGNRIKVDLPFKKSSHFNKMLAKGSLKTGVRLSKKQVTFMFDIPDKAVKTNGSTIGIDIGQNNAISCNNGYQSIQCNHGHDLQSITKKICRKKKGSDAFQKAVSHRKNYVNWTINQLNFGDAKECKIENIKNLRKGKRTSKRLSHWTYTDIFSKLESRCEEQGVLVSCISPTYTSKRCRICGWTRGNNRKGSLFKCGQCGHAEDADLNASWNIASDLEPIGYKERHLHDIKNGFWWLVKGEEPIVSPVREAVS